MKKPSPEIREEDAPPHGVLVKFKVTLPLGTPESETIYVAGNFNGWNPVGTPLVRQPSGLAAATITVRRGDRLEYKYTRGKWENVEKGVADGELPNRVAVVAPDAGDSLAIEDAIDRWADQ